jgi:hypothetical protein
MQPPLANPQVHLGGDGFQSGRHFRGHWRPP